MRNLTLMLIIMRILAALSPSAARFSAGLGSRSSISAVRVLAWHPHRAGRPGRLAGWAHDRGGRVRPGRRARGLGTGVGAGAPAGSGGERRAPGGRRRATAPRRGKPGGGPRPPPRVLGWWYRPEARGPGHSSRG